jgi:GT2 family glycosyltransferase
MREAGPRPQASVVIAACSQLRLLRMTLAAVYAQTHRDFEVVLVDDHSNDGTAAWVAGRSYPRLTLARNPRRLGPSRSRNRAVELSRGTLLAFLDHDDLWRPDYLRTMTRTFDRPEVMYACSDNDVIDGRGRVTLRRAMRQPAFAQPAFTALSSLERVPAFSATMVRRTAWDAVGGFDPGFRLYCDDSDFAFRVGLTFGPRAFKFVDRTLVSRRLKRRRASQISRLFDPLAPRPLDSLLRRWKTLDSSRRDIVFDVLRQRHKHRWWVDRLLNG